MKKSAVIIFLTMLSAFSAQNLFAKTFPYAGDLTGGINGSDKGWDSYADLMIPVAGNEESFIFLAPRVSMTGCGIFESGAKEFNIGIGFRKYLEKFLKNGAIVGFNAYYDTRNTAAGSNFQQAGAGVEFLSRWFDFRANAYLPFGNGEYFLGKYYDAAVNHYIAATYYYETALGGFDGEAGVKIPLPLWAGDLRIFGGYYYFSADKTESLRGFKGRAQYMPLNALRFNYTMYENNDFAESDWQAGVEITLPLDMRKFLQGKNPFAGLWDYIKTRPLALKDRIGSMVIRDMYIRTRESAVIRHNEKLSDSSGAEYYITVVSPNGTGGGTFENPANLEDGVMLNKTVSGNNAMLLLLGGRYNVSSTIDLGGHIAKEVLVVGPQEIEHRGGNLSKITSGNPLLETAAGVTAFSINSGGTENFLLSSVEFYGTGNTGTGVEISNYNKTFVAQNNNFTGFDSGAKVNNSSSSVAFYNNIFERNNTGAEISGGDPLFEGNLFGGNISQGVSLSSGSAALIRLNLFENNEKAVKAFGDSGSFVYGNTMYGGSYGIYSLTSSNTAFGLNDIGGISVAGIYSYGDSGILIEQNNIYAAGEAGISVIGSSGAHIISNDIFSNAKVGIYISGGSFHKIELNALSANAGSGLYAENVADAAIIQNVVSGSGVNGIHLKGAADSLVSDNTSSRNAVSGVFIENGLSVIVEKSKFYYNDTGILADGGTSVKISSNVADNNREGIRASGADGFIALSNDVSSNTACGMFFVNMNGAAIENNFTQHNKGYGGIYVENLNVSGIIGNSAAFNESAGITVKDSGGAVISLNSFDNDGGHGLHLIGASGVKLTWNVFQSRGGSSVYFGLYMQNNVYFDGAGSGLNRFFGSSYGGNTVNYENDVKPKDYFY